MRQHMNRLMVAGLVTSVLLLAACQKRHDTQHAEHPAEVKKIEGTELCRLTFSEKALQRIDLKTDRIREQMVSRSTSRQKVVPYSSLIYDPKGQTWIYTSPKARTFVRQKVDVDYIEGDLAVLKDGPPAGTVVATVGVAELYGTEFKVGH
jgi:nitrous oxide reductase accessory protein NosL